MFRYLSIYRRYVGMKRLAIFTLLSFSVGFTESLGIATVIPLLSLGVNGTTGEDRYSRLVVALFDKLGIHIELISMLGLILMLFTCRSVLLFAQEVTRNFIITKLSEDLRIFFAEAYEKMRYLLYVQTDIGFFNNIITTEIGRTTGGLKQYCNVIVSTVYAAVYLFFSFFISFDATAIIIVVGLLVLLLYKRVRGRLSDLSLEVSETNASIQNWFIQFIHNFKYLKATDNTRPVINKFRNEVGQNRKRQFRSLTWLSFTRASYGIISVLIFAGIIYYIVVLKGGQILAILVPLLLLNRALDQSFRAQEHWQHFQAKTGGIKTPERARKLLSKNEESFGGNRLENIQSEISLRHVRFSFNNEHFVLDDISLNIPKNGCIGIAGKSGSGKSTLLDIICGLITPQSGEVFIDGTSYSAIERRSLRRLFGVITQESVIFNDTFSNNVSLWDASTDELGRRKRIKEVIHLADCSDFISSTEMGLDMSLGDKGVKLSGGQRQRIAIARELYRNCPILIFDEATANLDSASEQFIQRSIEKMLGHKTIIIVAHRLSTLRYCDRILVLERGRIVEEGTWKQLIETPDTLFAGMCQQQGIRI